MKIRIIIRLFKHALALLLVLGSIETFAKDDSSSIRTYNKYCTIVDSYDYIMPYDTSIPSDYRVSIVKISAPIDRGLLIYLGKLYGNTSGINVMFDSEMVVVNPHPGSPYQLDLLLTNIEPGKSKTVVFQTKRSNIEALLKKLFFYEYRDANIDNFFPFVTEHDISSEIIIIPYIE